jgi:hypothetical protein
MMRMRDAGCGMGGGGWRMAMAMINDGNPQWPQTPDSRHIHIHPTSGLTCDLGFRDTRDRL